MKNSLKIGLIALVIATSFTACGGNKSTTVVDSTTKVTDTSKKDTTIVKTDTTKKDTIKK